jgi:serine/threonine-protein kinase
VAIKVLRGGALADEVARSRMASEARLASSIHHPGVAQVFDYDAASDSHGGMSFIVMEYIDGQSLAQLLREHGPMSVDEVMSVIQQVAEALAAAHAVGVVHRDLKPANIMLTPAGRTVLVDFGIARSAASEPLTDTGALLGTADYFSPEQAAGRAASAQSDLYSLGIVAHHCLTGRPPFRRDNQVATALAHLQDELPPLDPPVPVEVRDLVSHLAEKSPFDRPASAAEVARAAAGIGAAPSVDMPPTVESKVIGSSVTTPQAVLDVAPRSRRSLAILSAVGALAVMLVVLGINHLRSGPAAEVPDVVGMDVTQASARIEADGMTAKRDISDSAGTPAGQVVRQSPAPGEPRPADGTVEVTVASGKVGVSADEIIGSTYPKAAAALEELGFVVVRHDVPTTADAGEVLAVDRSGRLPGGSTITLEVAVPAPVAPAATPAVSTRTSASSTTRSYGSSGDSTAKGKAGKPKSKPKGRKK